MKLSKISSVLPIALGSILPLSANEYKFEDIKFDQVENKQDIYVPKDMLYKYIIDTSIYATKFIPLMNSGADGSDYTNIMANDGKRLLVDAGFDFVNSTAYSAIQKITFIRYLSILNYKKQQIMKTPSKTSYF